MGLVEVLLDPRQHEHLVVGTQPEQDREEGGRGEHAQAAQVAEAQESISPAVLKDERQHAIGCENGSEIHQDGLQRQEHRLEEHHQHDEGHQRYARHQIRQTVRGRIAEVHEDGAIATDVAVRHTTGLTNRGQDVVSQVTDKGLLVF